MKNKSNVEKSAKRKYFALADLLVLAVVIAVVALGCIRLFAPHGAEDLVCVVKVDGDVAEEIYLSEVRSDYEFKISGDSRVVLRVSSSGVQFVESACSDKLCVNTGMLTRAGQSAVCLPERVSVTLEVAGAGSSAYGPDAVVG